MIKYLNLFKALPVKSRTVSFSTEYIGSGVLVEDSVLAKYSKAKLKKVIRELVPTNPQMNQAFHKSWKKVRDASLEQLVNEQIIHYFSTYGLSSMGLYSDDTVFIPNEQLNLEGDGGITFYVLRGISPDEIGDRVRRLISSGVALSDSDLDDLVSVVKDQKLVIDPGLSKNKEMAVRLCDLLDIVPKDPVEYLRLQVYRATDSTMLIKNKETVESISTAMDKNVFASHSNVFKLYEDSHGLEGLASIFYRFKPLFLAFKNKKSAHTVNRIRKLAVKHHRPMPEDYLASATKNLRNGTFNVKKFRTSLTKANIFRKVKLVQALQFYGDASASGVVYSVRNGKSFTSTINPVNANTDEAILETMNSMSEDLSHLRGKRIYMNAGLTVPTSGKMFCGDVPFGSHFSTKDSLALGVSWKNVDYSAIDLDLSIVSISGKTGWDGSYRNNEFLFSGDITSAPNGATEAFLIRAKARDGIYILNLNYYNGNPDSADVPFTMFVTKENEFESMKKKSVMSQDNMLFWADSVIDGKNSQKAIGVLKIKNGIKTFHAFESKMGRGSSSQSDAKSANMISYYDKHLDSLLHLQDLLEWSGAKMVDDPQDADIDLSMKSLAKDALINLLVGD